MFGARMQNNPISNEEAWEILNANATPENKAQLNAAVPPNPSSETPTRNAVFGGQSSGFAAGVADRLSRSFYSEGAAASAETVAKGMGDNEIPRSIANKYALFNFQGFNGNLSTNQKDNYRDVPNNPLIG